MGELVVGRPALRLNYVVSLPLDLVSVMSLLYRAVAGSGLDPWLAATRRSLPDELREDLDLLHGFSGRLLYFMEEPIMQFEPLREDHRDATFDDLIAFLEELPAAEYRLMVGRALDRVHRDLGTGMTTPAVESEETWRGFIEPAITTGSVDEVLRFLREPEALKARVIRLIRGIWNRVYAAEWSRRLATLEEAAQLATGTAGFGFALAFVEMTGHRMPASLISGTNAVEAVTFCPSYHIGSFVSFTIYPPDLIVYFDAPGYIERMRPRVSGAANGQPAIEAAIAPGAELGSEQLLEGLRALGDPNRLRVIDLLGGGELYAQEIVGRLGIAQSAVSRHLALLERAGLVKVRPRGGMKYYAVDSARLDALANALRSRSRVS
jgi:DNA-binding transcriptional ArsR family regulator